jgi:uncharacterized membrane protein
VTFFTSPASAEALASLWRIEMLHPATVHFPVALLTVGAVLWLLGWWAGPDGRAGFLRPAASLLLAIGAAAAWFAVLTGFWAEDAVGPTVLNAPLLRDHQNLALGTASLATAVVLVELGPRLLARRFGPERSRAGHLPALARGVTAVLLLATLLTVGLAAHHGAALVYAEGAGVERISR